MATDKKSNRVYFAFLTAFTVLAILLSTASTVLAEEEKELTVYCGAGLTGAISEIAEIYENESNMTVKFNFDGVPALRAQIEEGAYADVLVSANVKHMKALQSE